MKFRWTRHAVLLFVVLTSIAALAGDAIPKVAWKRGIGEPLANAGTKKPALDGMIDDGYWQGAPVGGLGAGTFSRTYRGDFSRWHLKGGVHKYETVDANQFAIYEKAEGATEGVAQALSGGASEGGGAQQLEMGLSGGGGELLCALSEVVVRVPMGQASRQCNA